MATADQSFKSLLSDLIGDVGQLIRQELRLAQAEASQKVSRARHGATSIVVGAMLGFGALLILLQALVVALAEVVEPWLAAGIVGLRSEEHTSELQSLMRISYAVFCLKKK